MATNSTVSAGADQRVVVTPPGLGVGVWVPRIAASSRLTMAEVLGDLEVAAPWRHGPRPDHRAYGAVAAEVAADFGITLLEFPVWMTYWCDPGSMEAGSARLVRVVTDDVAGRDQPSGRSVEVGCS